MGTFIEICLPAVEPDWKKLTDTLYAKIECHSLQPLLAVFFFLSFNAHVRCSTICSLVLYKQQLVIEMVKYNSSMSSDADEINVLQKKDLPNFCFGCLPSPVFRCL